MWLGQRLLPEIAALDFACDLPAASEIEAWLGGRREVQTLPLTAATRGLMLGRYGPTRASCSKPADGPRPRGRAEPARSSIAIVAELGATRRRHWAASNVLRALDETESGLAA